MRRVRRQADRLRAAVAAAHAGAPWMAERLRASGLSPEGVHGIESLERLPVLRKEALPAAQGRALPFGGLLGAPVASLRRIYVSPGPIYDPEPHTRDYWGLAPALHAAGFRRGD
ncbi:MAG TPA: phenylacetate--CoA ligase family protein, partial [bacterium]|nr:phenylacetate--CoA ligase family protein [bacterium]